MAGKHSVPCETARDHKCVCTGCAGALHRWRYFLAIAAGDVPAEYVKSRSGKANPVTPEQFRVAANKLWDAACRPPRSGRKRSRPTGAQETAAVETAFADVIDWLAGLVDTPVPPLASERSPDHGEASATTQVGMPQPVKRQTSVQRSEGESAKVRREQVHLLATALGPQVVEEFVGSISSEQVRKSRREQMASHLWCTILATLSRVLAKIEKLVKKIPKRLIKLLLAEKARLSGNDNLVHKWAKLPDEVLRSGIAACWASISQLLAPGLPFDGQLKHLRITTCLLGLIMCPCPEKHRDVIEYCLKPLLQSVRESLAPVISEYAEARLYYALPEWMEERIA